MRTQNQSSQSIQNQPSHHSHTSSQSANETPIKRKLSAYDKELTYFTNRLAKEKLSNNENQAPQTPQTPIKRKLSDYENQSTSIKCKRQKLIPCSFRKQQEERSKIFFNKILKALGNDSFRNLCKEASKSIRLKDKITNRQMKEQLWNTQQEKVASYLEAPHLIQAFYANAHSKTDSERFIATHQWLSDMNIIHIFYRIKGERYNVERRIALKALEGIKDAQLDMATPADQIRESLSKNKCRVLDLSNTQLSEIPKCLNEFPVIVKIKENNIRILPGLNSSTPLKKLDLRGNQIDPRWTLFLPKNTKQDTIKVVDLGRNKLHALPQFLPQLGKLTTLSLANNKISYLPLSLTNMRQLTLLNLSHNNLTTLPEKFNKLTSLKNLNLSNNNFNTLPINLVDLPQLEILDISNNPLTKIPKALLQNKLTMLYISADQEELFSHLNSKVNVIIKSDQNVSYVEDSLEEIIEESVIVSTTEDLENEIKVESEEKVEKEVKIESEEKVGNESKEIINNTVAFVNKTAAYNSEDNSDISITEEAGSEESQSEEIDAIATVELNSDHNVEQTEEKSSETVEYEIFEEESEDIFGSSGTSELANNLYFFGSPIKIKNTKHQ